MHSCHYVEDSALGFGVHGTVFACVRASSFGHNALKIHERAIPYYRERDVYVRLLDLEIKVIAGHHVPALIDYDDELLAIEMLIVVRPFLLDFGGAYLDRPSEYDSEVLEQGKLINKNSSRRTGQRRPSFLLDFVDWESMSQT